MIHCLKNIKKINIHNQIVYNLGGSKRQPTPKDLDSYDVVWVGSNLGGICSSHTDKAAHGKFKMFVCFDSPVNQIYPVRMVYEQQHVKKSDYVQFSKLAINQFTPSELSSVKQILPDENAIILQNGRRIGYNHLVLATGMRHDTQQIKGFWDALEHPTHPVYSNRDPESWRANNHKYSKYVTNYKHGNGFFCIPQYPYAGEVECFNFFISDEIWKWASCNGALSPKHNFTIMNANEKFVHYCDSADDFIKSELQKKGVNVEYNQKLVEISKDNQMATFQNLKTGETTVREYQNLYSIMPTKPNEPLVNAGLTNSNGLLDVNHETLQHNKYKNIFGLGDCCDLPTTKTFWAGWYQIAVVRNNLIRSLQGQSLNAHYDGFSKVPLFTGNSSLTYIAHYYGGVGNWQHLAHKNGGPIASRRYSYWANKQASKFLNYYLGQDYGPPYHKFMKKFPVPAEEKDSSEGLLNKYFPLKSSH
ncbi:hypothetical protein IMG5_200230 [Ichthyophthirius multifiliis]|uniref:FAD/NAD(P)-binding domain-containing protein n=1 Tax=Ichthyophthirius multifiliis TaxID=5932 RepID=G0R5Q7_ICHMU|nr:hypothetical protein IMG5_200230 [Ichthyophthirius multifiliis]EGR27203.1 hypothetical protein IMG5_200230 [Ichthyophthirius multifiliis]|eukprot:XP_004024087.1 hypothetical protein IMG5_200230 [Ichthyophthirius multifiliis]